MSLSFPDAVMDPDIPCRIDDYITRTLKDLGWDPSRPDIPVCVTYPIEADAISVLVKNYSGIGDICELMSEWCENLEAIHDSLLDNDDSKEGEGRNYEKSPDDKVKYSAEDYLTEGLCLIFAQDFHPEPFKNILASHQGFWSPPPFYWALLKDRQVVETFKRLYDRNGGSEFLNAFLQDYCERRESLDDTFKVSAQNELTDITAHFSIFIKAFRELLVEFLTQDDLFEFGDDDPQHISRLVCHAENSYVYAQALLHFLPYSQPEFSSCRRLAQLTFRNLRRTRGEYPSADRMLLFTTLPNYPDLCELLRNIQGTDCSGRMNMTADNIIQLSDAIARVMRRFEKHKTLLLFHDVSQPLPKIAEEEGEIEPLPRLNGAQAWTWEVEMLSDMGLPEYDGEKNLLMDNPERKRGQIVAEKTDDKCSESGTVASQSKIIQSISWPVSSETKNRSQLSYFWNLPSASQMGDDEIILDEVQEENDRRGSTKLILPPMQAIRETCILDQLWEYLMCPGLPSSPSPMPVGKLVELVLSLSTLSDYELIVMHLQHEQFEMETAKVEDFWDENPDNDEESSLDPLDEDFFEEEEAERDIDFSVKYETAGSFHQDAIHGHAPPSDSTSDQQETTKRSWLPTVGCRTMKLDGKQANKKPGRSHLMISRGDARIDEVRKNKKPRIAASVVSSFMDKSVVPSMLESHIYRDPHEGSRLKAFRPEDVDQSARLERMFDYCSERRLRYLGLARKELFELYYIIREHGQGGLWRNQLSEDLIYKLLCRSTTSAGASAILRFLTECILNTDQEESEAVEDPVLKVSACLVTLLIRICLFHPRKRVLVVALCKNILERSFTGPFPATQDTPICRRRLIYVGISQLGISHTAPVCPKSECANIPWRAIEVDWTSSVVPGYKLLFNLIQELLYCFELTLLRETVEFFLGVCAPPYSIPYSESLSKLLREVVSEDCFDFELETNSNLGKLISFFLENIYSSWAPVSPPQKVLHNCQVIAEKLNVHPERMPLGFYKGNRYGNGLGGGKSSGLKPSSLVFEHEGAEEGSGSPVKDGKFHWQQRGDKEDSLLRERRGNPIPELTPSNESMLFGSAGEDSLEGEGGSESNID